MKVTISHHEIASVIKKRYSVPLELKTVDNKRIELSYKANRFVSMSVKLHIEGIRKDVVCLSYECSDAMSLIISGIVSQFKNCIPHGMEIDTNNKRLNIFLEYLKGSEKVMKYISLKDISFQENSTEISFMIMETATTEK